MPAVTHLRDKLVRSTLFRQALGTYGTQLTVAAIGVVVSAIVTRILGPEGRGKYSVAMAVGMIGVQLGHLGLHATNSYFVARDRSVLPSLVANALISSFVIGGCAATLAGAVFWLWPRLAPIYGWLLVLSLAWIPVNLAYLLTVNLLMGLRQVAAYNRMELLNRILPILLVFCVIAVRMVSPESVLLAMLLGMFLAFLVALARLWRFLETRVSPSLQLFQQSFAMGWKAYLATLFAFLVIRIDLLLVRYILGTEQAGFYSIAGAMADYVLLLPSAVGAILFPRLAAMQNDTDKLNLTTRASWGIGAALLLLLGVLGIFVRPIVRLVFGKAFLPAASAILLLMPGVFSLGLEVVLVQYLNSLGFPVRVVVLWAVTTALNVVLNLWAIPAFGIAGASVVSSLSYFLALVGVVWIIQAERRQRGMALPDQGGA
ncbi:MAG: oligosaccharide flippase family protein [Candidatus Sulfotelmatobacter sp.]